MRTTIRLDETLLRRAKARAAASGRSLNDFISDAVRAALAPGRAGGRPVELPTYPGGVLLPGVDLDDSVALLDLMDMPLTYASPVDASHLRKVAAEHGPA
ncbi:MAG TPA: toxin-antitoxin system HicB family antitoxin [Gemmatimonadaceae bacterium]|jgi:plasmid stability protein